MWGLAGLAALLIFLLYRPGPTGDPSDRITLMFSVATTIFGVGAVVGFYPV
jgi:hypothetical protein